MAPLQTPTTLSAEEIKTYRAFAMKLAQTAGAITCAHFRNAPPTENKSNGAGFDPVTHADREAETAISELIAKTYPDHGIYGEEHGRQSGSSPYTWVIDPIDGTRSFISGVPLWGTLVAFHDGVRPVIGVMDQPYIGEMFVGAPGGAHMYRANQSYPLKTSATTKLKEAILGCTDPAMFKAGAELKAFEAVAEKVKLRRFGGDCYFYCLLAAGFIDLVVEASLKPYDVQALIPIIENAGGVISCWDGRDAQNGGRIVAAANPALHAEALALLKI